MNSGIYNIVNTETGKQYIGSTANLKKRLSGHKRLLIRGLHQNPYLQRSWNKYGESAFIFGILEYADKSDLLKIEQQYLDATFPSGQLYNISLTAERPSGYKLTEASRQKMSAAHTGKRHTEEHKCKMSALLKGRIFTEETRQKMKNARKNRGPISDETRRKMSESHLGKHRCGENNE